MGKFSEPKKNQLTEIESQMDGIRVIDRDFYEFGYKTFELSKMIYSRYVRTGNECKAKIITLLKNVC